MSLSPSQPWEEGLTAAARTLRNLLRDVDSASAPLWTGPQLDAAVFRYTEIFMPMLAVHLEVGGGTRETENRLAAIKKAANEKLHHENRVVKNGSMYKKKLSDDGEREEFLAPFLTLGDDCARAAPIPPLDVAFCWALHRLSPRDYEEDCIRLFGKPLETSIGLEYVNAGNAGDPRSVVARLQWSCFSHAVRVLESGKFPLRKKRCIEERKTFLPKYLWPRFTELDILKNEIRYAFGFEEPTEWIKKYKYPLEYDIKAAARRQKQFLYNISGPYFETDAALLRGARRYKRFLMLMKDNPGQFLVPMYDIDLIWHAHILRDTAGYARDTREFVGKFINHKEDDDRAQGGQLTTGCSRTAQLWRKAYAEEYEDAETNYKGVFPDREPRVFRAAGTGIVVKADDEWRKEFVKAAVTCSKCSRRVNRKMCGKCQKLFFKAVRMKRSGQVRGGACAAMYSEGFVGAVATSAVAGGACGGIKGDARGSSGCGSGGGTCGTDGSPGDGGGWREREKDVTHNILGVGRIL